MTAQNISLAKFLSYQDDPMISPECGGTIKIVSIIDRHKKDVVKNILKHCDLGDDSSPPVAPNLFEAELEFNDEVTIDLDYFDMIA